MTGRRERRRKQLPDSLKENRVYWKLKEEILARTVWKTRFGRVHGTVVRQTAECMNLMITVSTFCHTMRTQSSLYSMTHELSYRKRVNRPVYTHSFFHGFGAYAPSVHAESVSVNAQPAETPVAWSLPTCPACRSERAHGITRTLQHLG